MPRIYTPVSCVIKLTNQEMDVYVDSVNLRYIHEYTPAIIFITFVIAVGLLGNSLAVIYYGCKAPKSVAQFFIVCLSLNDGVTNLILVHDVVDFCFTVKYLSVLVCQLFWVLKHWFVANSLFFMVALSLERYRRVCHPLARQMSFHFARFLVSGLCIFSLVLSVRYFATADVVRNKLSPEVNASRGYFCTLSENSEYHAVENAFHWIDICIHFIIICTLIVMYTLIVGEIIRSNRLSHDHIDPIRYNRKEPQTETTYTVESKTDAGDTSNADHSSSQTKLSSEKIYPKEINDIENNAVPKEVNPDDPHSFKQLPKYGNMTPNGSTTERIETTTDQSYDKNPQPFVRINKSKMIFKTNRGTRRLSLSLDHRITIMVTVITVASIACFVPYYLSVFLVENNLTGESLILSVENVIWRRSYTLNCIINPFIMVIFNESFRKFVRGVFRCRC